MVIDYIQFGVTMDVGNIDFCTTKLNELYQLQYKYSKNVDEINRFHCL